MLAARLLERLEEDFRLVLGDDLDVEKLSSHASELGFSNTVEEENGKKVFRISEEYGTIPNHGGKESQASE